MTKNSPPRGVQTWIHFFEEGTGRIWLRRLLVSLVLITLVLIYQLFEAQNFSAAEAMDQGQLARHLAEGRGYTTGNLRPLGFYLLRRGAWAGQTNELAALQKAMPDLENPPVYPLLWAACMKILPEWSRHGVALGQQATMRPPPEVVIGVVNLFIFGVSSFLVFRLAHDLFGHSVAPVAVGLFLGSEILWRFAYSGLSTHLAVLEVLVLSIVLAEGNRDGTSPSNWGLLNWKRAVSIGALLALMTLTRYSLGWLAIPTFFWLLRTPGRHRILTALLSLAVFLVMVSPWVARNWALSRTPFGTSGYAIFSGTPGFPGQKLQRSQHPNLKLVEASEILGKVGRNTVAIFENELPRLGGSWCGAFFIAGILLPMADPHRRRMRNWLLACLGTFVLVQAGVQTDLSRSSPQINAENLLIILLPLLAIFSAGAMESMLGRRDIPFPLAGILTRVGIILMGSLPLVSVTVYAILAILGIVPRRHYVLVDPPYRPAVISTICGWVPQGSLMMSDIPWAVAWYGGREACWMPLRIEGDDEEDFYRIHLRQHPVKAILLSPATTNGEFRENFLINPDMPWGMFYLDLLARGQLPKGFPLTYVESDLLQLGYCVIAESEWWKH